MDGRRAARAGRRDGRRPALPGPRAQARLSAGSRPPAGLSCYAACHPPAMPGPHCTDRLTVPRGSIPTMSHSRLRRPDERIVTGVTRLTRRRAGALALLCTLSTLLIAAAATARPPSAPAALSPADFHPIEFGPLPSRRPTPSRSVRGADDARADRRLRRRAARRSRRARCRASRTRPASVTQGAPDAQGSSTGKSARGSATWYCKTGVSACHSAYPGGYYAAAGPALRVGDWRGRVVRVCGSGSCVERPARRLVRLRRLPHHRSVQRCLPAAGAAVGRARSG